MSSWTLQRIEKFLRSAKISPSRLGKEAAGDPALVFDLRRGRKLRARTQARLKAWLDAAEKRLEDAPSAP